MAFTKAHARIASSLLSETAAQLLKKKFLGQSHMGHVTTWQELIDNELVEWSIAQETYVLTQRGKKVAAEL